MPHAILLVASSLLTAMVASFILAIVMIVVVIVSHRSNINPDNVATPIAYQQVNGAYTTWFCLVLTATLVLLIPVWIVIAHSNCHTWDGLFNGWAPIVSAMAISSVGGLILGQVHWSRRLSTSHQRCRW